MRILPGHSMETLKPLSQIDRCLWNFNHDRVLSNTLPTNQKFSTPDHKA
jgi:hypothetical protein